MKVDTKDLTKALEVFSKIKKNVYSTIIELSVRKENIFLCFEEKDMMVQKCCLEKK